ncbi:MAG: hypothetical protein ACJ8F1_11930 [Polyangia bacterium]
MTRPDLPPDALDPELESLVHPPKIVRRAPPDVQARALARARVIVSAGGVKPAAWPGDAPALHSLSPSWVQTRAPARMRIAFAAAVAVVAVAVGAIASLRGRDAEPEVVAPDPVATPAAPMPARPGIRVRPVQTAPSAADQPVVQRAVRVRPARSFRVAASVEPVNAELELLQRAQAAYTRHEFASALTLLADHARRFPRGHLSEERDALQVRCLLGAGRTGEAHRAAVTFGIRFPRSVLLPRVDSAERD